MTRNGFYRTYYMAGKQKGHRTRNTNFLRLIWVCAIGSYANASTRSHDSSSAWLLIIRISIGKYFHRKFAKVFYQNHEQWLGLGLYERVCKNFDCFHNSGKVIYIAYYWQRCFYAKSEKFHHLIGTFNLIKILSICSVKWKSISGERYALTLWLSFEKKKQIVSLDFFTQTEWQQIIWRSGKFIYWNSPFALQRIWDMLVASSSSHCHVHWSTWFWKACSFYGRPFIACRIFARNHNSTATLWETTKIQNINQFYCGNEMRTKEYLKQ